MDGLEDFNDLIYDKKNLNIKYNTIQINQIQKSIPILLSDEAFNRKMKEYQTEIFRRKKDLEINDDIENRINKTGIKNINVNNSQELNMSAKKYLNSDDIFSSDKKNDINNSNKKKENINFNENQKLRSQNRNNLFKREDNINNYKKINDEDNDDIPRIETVDLINNENNIEENEEEKININNKI